MSLSLNPFLNQSVRRLDPFSTGAYIHMKMIPGSLDPFRKMFKRQKTSFPGTTSF